MASPMRMFVAPSTLNALPTGHPRYDTYDARFRLCGTYYEFIGAASYVDFVAGFDAAKADDPARIVSVMPNIEFPWLGMLSAKTDATPSVSWYTTYLSVTTAEFARQGYAAPSAATPMSLWKSVAERLWREVVDYARENGTENVFHYATPGWATTNSAGAPHDGVRPSSSISFWGSDPVYYPPFEDVVAEVYAANGELPSLMRAQENATAHGLGFYTIIPDFGSWSDAAGAWQLSDSNFFRKNAAGVTVSPDYEETMTRRWEASTLASCTWHYQYAMNEVAGADPTLEATAALPVAMIALAGPASPDLAGNTHASRNHWIGLFWDDPADQAEAICGSLFRAADAETPNVATPSFFLLWYSAAYYCRVYPRMTRSAQTAAVQKGVDQIRHAYEKLFYGRPQLSTSGVTGVDPTGSADFALHDAFFAAQNAGDTYWSEANGSTVLRDASGVVAPGFLALGLDIDFTEGGCTERLAPFFTAAQVAGTAAITVTDAALAIAEFATDYIAQLAEACADIVASYDAGEGKVTAESVLPAGVVRRNRLFPGQSAELLDAAGRIDGVRQVIPSFYGGIAGGTW